MSPHSPYAILYDSVATEPLSGSEVGALALHAAQANRRLHLTGALLYSAPDGDAPAVFMQWLEGPRAAVGELYGRIERDPRHTRLAVHAAGPLRTLTGRDDRLFPAWGMAFETVEDRPASFDAFVAYWSTREAPDTFEKIRAFYRRGQRRGRSQR